MKFNNVNVAVDFYDPDFLEKFENASDKVQEEAKRIEEIEKASEQMRKLIAVLQDFINEVFDDRCDEIVGPNPKFIEIMNFYDELAQERIRQDAKMDKFQTKYSIKKLK